MKVPYELRVLPYHSSSTSKANKKRLELLRRSEKRLENFIAQQSGTFDGIAMNFYEASKQVQLNLLKNRCLH